MVNVFGRKRTAIDNITRRFEYNLLRINNIPVALAYRARDWRSSKILLLIARNSK